VCIVFLCVTAQLVVGTGLWCLREQRSVQKDEVRAMRILFVGQAWLGSCARSMKEALGRQANVEIDEVNEDLYFPRHNARCLRGIHRILRFAYATEFRDAVLTRIALFQPDIVLAYKGNLLDGALIREIKARNIRTANVYPDVSPHAHGGAHRAAVGEYDLVISTKQFHPQLWKTAYGYSNDCVFIPQGYDPRLHLASMPPISQRFDVTLVASWRPEYDDLMRDVGRALSGRDVTIGIGGSGWMAHRRSYPAHWVFAGPLQGRSYVEWLRQGKVCIAPVTRDVVVGGVRQHGDEDTTRTYELAAAYCFFIHRRTELVETLYDEGTEVPLFDDADELAGKIRYYLGRDHERAEMARRAHTRAVPAYSLDERAAEVIDVLGALLRG